MKRTIICIFLISSMLFISSCASKTQAAKKYTPSVNHSYLTEENIGNEIVIKGKLIKSGSNFALLENPDSKSRVSFSLEFEDESLKQKLTAGSFVQLSGILTSSESPWKKSMKVLKVE